MMKTVTSTFFAPLIAAVILLTAFSSTGEAAEQIDIYSGYYSRAGNDDRAAKTTGNSIYLKFYEDLWVVMLYVPYPYSLTLKPSALNAAFEDAKRQAKSRSYIRSKFGILDEKAVAHVELYSFEEDNKVRFECDGTAPCRVIFDGDSMEMIKAGMLNEHILPFIRIDE